MLGALKAVFCLMCLFAGETAEVPDQTSPPPILQKTRSMSANVGQRITLECYYDSEKIFFLYWYKQTLGEKPKLMATFHRRGPISLYGEFQNDLRFTGSSESGINHLVIADLNTSDSATYYCATRNQFAEGTTVLVQGPGAGFPVWVHQWVSGTNQSNGSVTLQCRVETGSCAGGARVYWLRESREAETGVFYADGGSQQQQCVIDASAQTHSCLYTLPMSLDPSHTGIYYCAVAMCGRLLFGNSTKQDFRHDAPADEGPTPSLVFFLGTALAFTSVLCLSLAVFLCVMHRRSKSPASVTTNQEDGGNHDVQYGAINIKKDRGPRRRGEEAEPECMYARVRQ